MTYTATEAHGDRSVPEAPPEGHPCPAADCRISRAVARDRQVYRGAPVHPHRKRKRHVAIALAVVVSSFLGCVHGGEVAVSVTGSVERQQVEYLAIWWLTWFDYGYIEAAVTTTGNVSIVMVTTF